MRAVRVLTGWLWELGLGLRRRTKPSRAAHQALRRQLDHAGVAVTSPITAVPGWWRASSSTAARRGRGGTTQQKPQPMLNDLVQLGRRHRAALGDQLEHAGGTGRARRAGSPPRPPGGAG